MIHSLIVIDNDADRSYIKALFIKFYPIMRRTIFNIVEDENIVDDLIDDTIIKLIRNLEIVKTLNPHAQITYIVYAAKNRAIDYIRQNRCVQYWESFDNFPETGSLSIEKQIEVKEQASEIKSVLFKMNGRDRELLWYRYYMQFSLKEISRETGIKEKQVAVYLRNARLRALKLIKRGDL